MSSLNVNSRNVHDTIRNVPAPVSNKRKNIRKNSLMLTPATLPLVTDPTLHYNGAPEEYEDYADYLPRAIGKAVRLG